MEKLKKQPNFYTKKVEVKSIYYSNQSIILFVYNEVYFNTNKLDPFIPNIYVFFIGV